MIRPRLTVPEIEYLSGLLETKAAETELKQKTLDQITERIRQLENGTAKNLDSLVSEELRHLEMQKETLRNQIRFYQVLKKRVQSWLNVKKSCQDPEKTETDLKTSDQNPTEPQQSEKEPEQNPEPEQPVATVQAVPDMENSDDLGDILTHGIDPRELFGESYNINNRSRLILAQSLAAPD